MPANSRTPCVVIGTRIAWPGPDAEREELGKAGYVDPVSLGMGGFGQAKRRRKGKTADDGTSGASLAAVV